MPDYYLNQKMANLRDIEYTQISTHYISPNYCKIIIHIPGINGVVDLQRCFWLCQNQMLAKKRNITKLIPLPVLHSIIGLIPFKFTSFYYLDIEAFGTIEFFISASIGVFSILLLLLSLSAYKETRVKSILYASAAFGLFAVSLFVETLEDYIENLDSVFSSLLVSCITLAILILFFMAIVRRNK